MGQAPLLCTTPSWPGAHTPGFTEQPLRQRQHTSQLFWHHLLLTGKVNAGVGKAPACLLSMAPQRDWQSTSLQLRSPQTCMCQSLYCLQRCCRLSQNQQHHRRRRGHPPLPGAMHWAVAAVETLLPQLAALPPAPPVAFDGPRDNWRAAEETSALADPHRGWDLL